MFYCIKIMLQYCWPCIKGFMAKMMILHGNSLYYNALLNKRGLQFLAFYPNNAP